MVVAAIAMLTRARMPWRCARQPPSVASMGHAEAVVPRMMAVVAAGGVNKFSEGSRV